MSASKEERDRRKERLSKRPPLGGLLRRKGGLVGKRTFLPFRRVRGLSCLTEQVLGAVHQARVLTPSTCPLWTARGLGTFALNVCADLGPRRTEVNLRRLYVSELGPGR